MKSPRRLAAAAAVATLAFGLAACGDDSTEGATTSTTAAEVTAAFPVTIKTSTGDVVIDERPEKIVSLSPTATEMLWAIGADEQVVAVDDQSNYPADVPKTALSGYQPNIEAIAGYDPDLVIAATDSNDLVAGLRKLDIPVLMAEAAKTLDDTYRQLGEIGLATGHVAEAQGVVADIKEEVETATAAVEDAAGKRLTYYHELDDQLYSASSKTFIGQLYAVFGLENIADPADTEGTGYPQLSAEAIFAADPDVIFLADTKCCGQSAQTVAARPGWSNLTAVKNGSIVALDDDVASRWGPRVVDLLRAIADGVEAAAAKAA